MPSKRHQDKRPSVEEADRAWMRRALKLARRGMGAVEPNPMVGCVLVKNGRLIGEGYHRRFGGPHAEVNAMAKASEDPRGATAYVTLEPCCFHGKTPACTDALIGAGVARVAAAVRDPNPRVAGKGIALLRRAGIKVDVGVGRIEATSLIAPYQTLLLKHRPYVLLKWAQSIDGKIATRTRHSKWITGEPARAWSHRLRARVDAILVGIGTVLADDPLLTARDVPIKRRAIRVVLDTQLRMPTKSALLRDAGDSPVIVLASRRAMQVRKSRANALRQRGAEVVACATNRRRIDLPAALNLLADRHCTNLLVEGGGQVLSAFLDAGLADEVYVWIAPRLIGGTDAVSAYAGLGCERVEDGPNLTVLSTRIVGQDWLHHLRLANQTQ